MLRPFQGRRLSIPLVWSLVQPFVLSTGKDIFAGLKNLVGGELKAYTELLNESRNEAIQRMMMQANQMGANAIVNVRFATSNVAAGASELFCYGTAVIVQ